MRKRIKNITEYIRVKFFQLFSEKCVVGINLKKDWKRLNT